jgi:hypothetical protein
MSNWKILGLTVLLLAVLFQAGRTLGSALDPLRQVWKAMGKSAVWRGVNFSSGQGFANYVEFLTETIPPQAQVLLPPERTGPPAMSRTPYMQFYLAPRQVVNCTEYIEKCAENFAAAGGYILVVQQDHFPASSLLEEPSLLKSFDGNLGVLLPRLVPSAAGAQGSTALAGGNASFLQIALKLVWPGLWLLVVAAAGWLICCRFAPSLSSLSRMALGFGLGTGAYSLILYLALLAGLQLTPWLVLSLTLLWAATGLLVYFLGISGRRIYFRPGPFLRPKASHPMRTFDYVILAVCLCAAGLTLALAIGQGYHWSDEVVLWGVKGYGIAARGLSPGVSEWGTRTTSYPLLLPVTIGAFRVLFGDGLPESKIIFPLYYLCLLIVMFDFLLDRFAGAVNRAALLAGLLTLLYAAVPLVFYHATLAYANLPLTFYMVSAGILLTLAFDASDMSALLGLLLLGGIFLALAAWTRPDGLVMSILVLALAVATLLFAPVCQEIASQSSLAETNGKTKTLRQSAARKDRFKWRLVALLYLGGPLAIYSGLWLGTSALVYRQSGWSDLVFRSGIEQILAGHINLEGCIFVLRSFLAGFFDLNTWGILGISLLLLVGLIPLFFKRRNSSLVLVGAGLLCLLATLGLYWLMANDPGSNISWWVDTGLSRMLLPGMSLLWLGLIVWAAGAAPARQVSIPEES